MESELVECVLLHWMQWDQQMPFCLISNSSGGRIVSLDLQITDSTNFSPFYLFVYDSGDPSQYLVGGRTGDRPLIAPLACETGDRIVIEPNTKWLPFKRGLVFAPSSTESVFTPLELTFPLEGPAVGVGFSCSYHIMIGC